MAQSSDEFISRAWYSSAKWLYLLWPLSVLYYCVILLRKWCYARQWFTVYRASKPVIVVGNITVGGTGKSPLVCYLVEALRDQGLHPGIVSRGYGANIATTEVREVSLDSQASEVGDEPLMLKRRLDCPVFVSPSRTLAVQALEQTSCDVIICDDGLQHYALARDIEVCVFDGKRLWGNGHLLPMGPLREPLSRLREIPFLVVNGAQTDNLFGSAAVTQQCFTMTLQAETVCELQGKKTRSLSELSGQSVHAVAAIGHPERFFQTLEKAGLKLVRHAFADHHAYQQSDFTGTDFQLDEKMIIMTEKDAVKCRHLALKNAWYLPVNASLDRDLSGELLKTLGIFPVKNETNQPRQ